MTWVNQNGQTQIQRPIRVRLPDGFTRTNEEVTDEILSLTGWNYVVDLAGPEFITITTATSSTVAGEVI